MSKSRYYLIFIIIIYLNIFVVPSNAQEYTEITGVVSAVNWGEGEYYVNGNTVTNSPAQVKTFTASETGWGYFYVEGTNPPVEDLWFASWRRVGETEFNSGNFQVNKGEMLEVEVWPRVYEESMTIVGDDLVLVKKYHAQSGNLMYFMGYTESVESELLASCTHSPTYPLPGEQVQIVSTTTVQNAEISTIKWFVNGAQMTAYDNMNQWTWTAPGVGFYDIEIEVTDSTGKMDFFVDTISVKEESSYTILDTAFTTGIQNNQPVDRKTSFSYGEDIYFWMKLGNVKGGHSVYVAWETPRENEIVSNVYIDIPAPSTQGKTEWSEYIVYTSVKQGSSEYDLMIGDPGYWKAKGLIDSDSFEYSFRIEGSLRHEANLAKSKYTTREAVEVQGSLTFNGAPIQGSSIIPELYRNGQLFETLPEITVASNGGYSLGHVIPVLQLNESPSKPEDWSIRLTPIMDPKYGQGVKEIGFKVLPIWITIEDVELVQVVEVPVIDDGFFSTPHIAADRMAGARVSLIWHGYETGFTPPQIDVHFSQENRDSGSEMTSGYSPVFEEGKGYVDVYYTLPVGVYRLKSEVDRDEFYLPANMRNAHLEEVTWSQIVTSKEMKKLDLEFIPIELNLDFNDPTVLERYLKWVKEHEDFIRDTFPLPSDHVQVTVKQTIWDVPDLLEKKGGILSRISDGYYKYIKKVRIMGIINTGNLFSNTKTIGVLPREADWWSEGKDGFATARMFKRVVMVKWRTAKGVSAHEIGHTFGLYNGYKNEQYDLYKPSGKEVQSLILKDGKIYDLTVPTPATPPGTRPEVDREIAFNPQVKQVFCFMGTNIWDTWVSEETYKGLFEALMDPFERCVLVQGIVAEGEEYIDLPWFVGEAEPDFLPYGNYSVNCFSESGEVLYSGLFGNEDPVVGFSLVIPYPEGTSRIEVRKGDTVIFTKTPSSNIPVVTSLVVEKAGQDKINVRYNADDADGDELTYLMLYSSDAGESWTNAYPETFDTEVEIDVSDQPGGDNCMVKLVASDGFNTVESVSSTFSVINKAPIAAIIEPLNNVTYYAGREIELIGAGYDLEDGSLENLVWQSDRDGLLGMGGNINANLTAGVHLIAMTVEDENGESKVTTKSITVAERPTIELTSHTLSKNITEDGIPIDVSDVFLNDEKIISLLLVSNAVQGDTAQWVFQGPTPNLEYMGTFSSGGDTGMIVEVDLSQYPIEEVVGTWTISVSLNEAPVSTLSVRVEERQLGGFVWWGGLVGLVIIGAIIGGGYMVLKRRKKEPQQISPSPVQAESNKKQRFCDNCGKPATWIEEYQRWYCYDCEKYLE